MTFTILRRASVVAIVLNVACAFLALFWLVQRIRDFMSANPPWPWWQDFAVLGSAAIGGIALFSAAALWMFWHKTRDEPARETRLNVEREDVRKLEIEVQRAELQKRLRDLTQQR